MTDQSPARALVAALDPAVAASFDDRGLDDELRGYLERGRAGLAAVELGAAEFAAHLGRHCRRRQDLAQLQVEDLYLACACVARHEVALAELLRRLAEVVERTVPAEHGDDPDEIRLAVTQRLVMDDPPKIAGYAGRGSLCQWLAAAVARERIGRRRTAARRRARLDQAADALAPADPELAFLKTHYRAEFKAAFTRALDGLAPNDRTVLRHRLVDALTLDQLAAACGVHRATAARWLARIRAELLASTRSELRRRLGVEEPELDSVVRLIASNFEVSVRRLLGERRGA